MTLKQQQAFLRELGETGNVAFACRAAGVEREVALRQRQTDAMFEKLWRSMESRARTSLEERIACS